jgi:CHRD domain
MTNNKLVLASFIVFAMLAMAATNSFINSVSAQQQFTAKLSGKNEVPVESSPATGIALFTVSPDGTTLRYVLNVTGITGVTAAHIHAGASAQNGPVVATLFSQPATGKVNGLLSKGNITASNLTGSLAGKQLSDLVNLIKSGNTYVNIHTTQNPKGEVRGQLS